MISPTITANASETFRKASSCPTRLFGLTPAHPTFRQFSLGLI
jgi:hypothetical protein